jgi:2-iminoacetate synthase ThiH
MISPRRIPVERWCEIIRAAHSVGIPTTSTIMYGHIESAADVAEHMGILRSIQAETDDEEKGRFTEFVPLPFIPYDNTMGPEFGINKVADLDYIFRIHAVARLFLKDSIKNIQVAWPKIGIGAAKQALSLGVNDMGGTLLEENITRESGGEYGQALTVGQFREAIATAGRTPVQRSTTYERIPEDDPRYRPPRPGDDEMLGEKSTGGEKLISL